VSLLQCAEVSICLYFHPVYVTVFVGSHDTRTDIFIGELQLQAQPGVHSSVTGVSITPLAQVACKNGDMHDFRLASRCR
jgi:hypothetical protein